MINVGKKIGYRTNITGSIWIKYKCYAPNNHIHEEKVWRDINQNISHSYIIVGIFGDLTFKFKYLCYKCVKSLNCIPELM